MHSSIDQPIVRVVTPLPPLATGIAQYSQDLLTAVDGTWHLVVAPEHGSAVSGWRTVRDTPVTRRRSGTEIASVFQLGNSGFHRRAFAEAERKKGIVVLHDTVLHQGRLPELLRKHGGRDYRRIMARRYGASGARFADAVVSGTAITDFSEFPLFEDLVDGARLAVVHSDFARKSVLDRVPDADIEVVPMGIPLPALVEQRVARRALNLPESAYVVASITHVNPNKRIPVVMRAIARLARAIPDIVFVIAGSVAPGIDLALQARAYDVEKHVRILGYVSDAEARLLARAADVCVNLRHPWAGETSASLLRLLGAARPVLVTDNASANDLPRSAVIPIPVDRYEVDMIAESLRLLHDDSELRQSAGQAGRAYIERQHSMSQAVAGYSRALYRAFGLRMPDVAGIVLDENAPIIQVARPAPYADLDGCVADIIVSQGLYNHEATQHAVARAMVDLGLNRLRVNRRG